MPRLCMLLLLSAAAVSLATSDSVVVDLHQLDGGNHTIVKRSPYKAYGSRGCLDLRSKRYISDGFCTTVRPVAEAVCVARCLEPFEASSSNSEVAEAATQVEWRCTQGATRRKMIRFLCRDGSRRVYQIRLVTKCECKKFSITAKHSSSAGKKVKRLQ